MNYPRAYRKTLKLLHKASFSRPHFLIDLRVLLSCGAIPNVAPSVSSRTNDGEERLPVHHEQVFKFCKSDLRAAIERDISSFSGTRVNPLVSQILYTKELEWLARRLEKICCSDTSEKLKEVIRVSYGPDENSFIPESYFQQVTPGFSGSSSCSENVVYSAGAIGYQRELLVHRSREKEFPLVHSFIGPALLGVSTFEERHTRSNCMSSLLQSLEYKLAKSIETTCNNVKVKIQLLPFDQSYEEKSEAGIGHFRTAHRQFYAHICAEQLQGKVIQVVNTHFFRLEMSSRDLLEDIGYLESSQIANMIQEDIEAKSPTYCDTKAEVKKKGYTNLSSFKVAFKSLSDGAVVVKGILYIKQADSDKLLPHSTVEAVPFGPAVFLC